MDLFAHLRTFVAVGEELSFSRAAEELAIAQPLLSRRIKTLEDHLGGDLFDRSRRQIEVTEFGVLLLPYAQDVIRRAEQLHTVARSARTSAVRSLGVPPDCDPKALARVIRAAAERGIAISVHELPAVPRAAALADGSLALALLRVPPDTAALGVPLGLASAAPPGTTPGRPIHLDGLRPRRGADRTAGPALLVTPEDDLPLFSDPLRRAAARAGLPEERIRVTPATATALAEMLAGEGLLLCAERFARRHQVAWAPLADTSLRRGYELGHAPGRSIGRPSERPDGRSVGQAVGQAGGRSDSRPGGRSNGGSSGRSGEGSGGRSDGGSGGQPGGRPGGGSGGRPGGRSGGAFADEAEWLVPLLGAAVGGVPGPGARSDDADARTRLAMRG